MNRKLIGIIGKKGHGKTTAANYLAERYQYHVLNFEDIRAQNNYLDIMKTQLETLLQSDLTNVVISDVTTPEEHALVKSLNGLILKIRRFEPLVTEPIVNAEVGNDSDDDEGQDLDNIPKTPEYNYYDPEINATDEAIGKLPYDLDIMNFGDVGVGYLKKMIEYLIQLPDNMNGLRKLERKTDEKGDTTYTFVATP
ncbi:MAG: hypothetical protein Hyperionvirus3_112 [Hyperionvirus sp.]|uniref:Uncharacterized protein n=1 Tax=Hyperionvirus sp. TaxID=2487770 RepID=A0A3G5A6T3_9VIRU|nr:MAG: hypothetical protein Hyperionvirus3_112 [Hyperionvirus sp.]